jgi:hypothetical protein
MRNIRSRHKKMSLRVARLASVPIHFFVLPMGHTPSRIHVISAQGI